MKRLLFPLFVLIFLDGFSQNVTIIDKTDETAWIFDVNQVGSLMWQIHGGLLENYSVAGIDESDYENLSATERISFDTMIGRPGVTPLIYDDPNAPNYGEPIIVTDENGLQYFVYDPPDTFVCTLTGIERIIVEYGENTDRVELKKLALCIQSNDQYVPVLYYEGPGLMSFERLNFIRDFDAEQTLHLQKNYWPQVQKNYFNAYPMHMEFSEGFNLLPYIWQGFPDVPNLSENAFKDVQVDVSQTINVWRETGQEWIIDSLKQYFDSISYSIRVGRPMFNSDPGSVDYGKVLMQYDSLQQKNVAVMEPDHYVIRWLYFSPKFLAEEETFLNESGVLESRYTKIFAMLPFQGRYEIVLTHRFKDQQYSKYFADMSLDYNWEEIRRHFYDLLRVQGKEVNFSEKSILKSYGISESIRWED